MADLEGPSGAALSAELTALVQEWRARIHAHAEGESKSIPWVRARAIQRCADELAALVSRAATPAKEPLVCKKETGEGAWYPTIRQEVEALTGYVLFSEDGIDADRKAEIVRRLKDMLKNNHESRSPDGDGQETTNPASGTLRGSGRRVPADALDSRTGATSSGDRTELTRQLGFNDDRLRGHSANDAAGSEPADSHSISLPVSSEGLREKLLVKLERLRVEMSQHRDVTYRLGCVYALDEVRRLIVAHEQ